MAIKRKKKSVYNLAHKQREEGNEMEQLQQFIKPELLILIPVLYFVGAGLKRSEVNDKYIPYILGLTGVVLSALYVCGTEAFTLLCVFTAITQGIMCAGASVYVNQLIKQRKK